MWWPINQETFTAGYFTFEKINVFCHITRNWRGVPLETHEIVVNLVSSTRTNEGLEVHCWLDEGEYKKGRKVTNRELEAVRIKRNAFHGDWNYEILPNRKS